MSKFGKLTENKLAGVHFVSSTTGKGIKRLAHDLLDTLNNLSYLQSSIPSDVATFEKGTSSVR